jgi:hypothetical protein
MKKPSKPARRLALAKRTLKNLVVKTGIRAGQKCSAPQSSCAYN